MSTDLKYLPSSHTPHQVSSLTSPQLCPVRNSSLQHPLTHTSDIPSCGTAHHTFPTTHHLHLGMPYRLQHREGKAHRGVAQLRKEIHLTSLTLCCVSWEPRGGWQQYRRHAKTGRKHNSTHATTCRNPPLGSPDSHREAHLVLDNLCSYSWPQSPAR